MCNSHLYQIIIANFICEFPKFAYQHTKIRTILFMLTHLMFVCLVGSPVMSPTSMGPLSVTSSVPSPDVYPQGISPRKYHQ